jgi:hypothetical protein
MARDKTLERTNPLQTTLILKPPDDIDADLTTFSTGMPADTVLIDDPTNRIYRGPDPTLFPRDRSEVVHFPNPGTYLVICGLHSHFVEDGMFGFVEVLP